MDNDFLELFVPKQKVVANPKQVVFRLFLNWNERAQTCVDKKKISTHERIPESLEKLTVGLRHRAGENTRKPGLIIE